MNYHDKAHKTVLCQLKVVVREKRKDKMVKCYRESPNESPVMIRRKSRQIAILVQKSAKNRQIDRFYRDEAHN
jgi:hypothetical protein